MDGMRIVVLKFGGTSVETPEARERVLQRIEDAYHRRYGVVVVVSAMGRRGQPYATDTLLGLIGVESGQIRMRERDLVFSCGEIIAGGLVTALLQQRGYLATYLTGSQAGIITTGDYGDAEILDINTKRILSLLAAKEIVVVAGAQGATLEGEITTLGRGGSDTTACALGVALDAEMIEIYTDVNGIMTADPRIVPDARLLSQLSHQSCCLLAKYGAKILHPRSVQIAARKPHIPLRVRSTFSSHPGTLIGSYLTRQQAVWQDVQPIGVAALHDQTLYQISKVSSLMLEMVNDILPADEYAIVSDPVRAKNSFLYIEAPVSDRLLSLLISQGFIINKVDGLSRISLVGENLNKARLLNESLSLVAENGIDTIAADSSAEVITLWVQQEKATQVVNALHKLVLRLPVQSKIS